MSSEYPDVLGDLVEARQRCELKAVHYVMAPDPGTVAPGETTAIHAWLQSCWDVPVELAISVHLPTSPSSDLYVLQKRTDVPLRPAEAGELTIPLACSPEASPGVHKVPVSMDVKLEARGRYIRSQKSTGSLGGALLSFTSGMALSTTVGVGFAARTYSEQDLRLHVEGVPQHLPAPDLVPTYVSHWTVDDLPLLGKARQLVNDQRLFLLPKMSRQSLYLGFLDESRRRFQAAALPLHIGEALFLAKVLTYVTEYFLKQPDWQDAILVPPYVLAHRHDLPMDDPVWLVVRADYARIARLAASLSFGLLRKRLQKDIWTPEEQLAVAGLITARLEQGGPLAAEFLYLPLLLGALLVAGEIQMPGEQIRDSLESLAQARRKRDVELQVNPELTALLDRLLQQAQP